MSKFIEIHVLREKRLINTALIEEIRAIPGWFEGDFEGAEIYFAYSCPNSTDQDHVSPDESYEELKNLIQGVA